MMKGKSLWRTVLCVLLLVVLPVVATARDRDQYEVQYPEAGWTRLGTFEAHSLSLADKAFKDRKYREAITLYDAFIAQFMDSAALPYALMRKGRSLQHDGKRFEALREYAEVLDYFPNNATFAGAALYYTGQVHWENGAIEPAMRAWAQMAQDQDYRRHRLAAYALNALGDNLMRQERYREAVHYYRQVMDDFKTDRPAREHVIPRVITHLVRRQPDEGELRAFYRQAGAFHPHRPAEVPEDLESDRDYWSAVIRAVNDNRSFGDDAETERRRFFSYWAARLDGRFESWDHYRIALADYRLQADGNLEQWFERLDRQFEAHQETDDFDRVTRWISLYRNHRDKLDAYYRNYRFEAMAPAQVVALMRILYEAEHTDMARNLISRLRYDDMTDREIHDLCRQVIEHYDRDRFDEVCLRMTDNAYAKSVLLEFYYRIRQHHHLSLNARQQANCLPLAEEVAGLEQYAQRGWWIKGEFLFMDRKWEEAISAYRTADNPTANLFRIAQCHERLQAIERAVQQLTEIENFFPRDASRAAYEVAEVYRRASDAARQVASLRRVMSRYPDSRESRDAHVALQRLDVSQIGGGVDAQ